MDTRTSPLSTFIPAIGLFLVACTGSPDGIDQELQPPVAEASCDDVATGLPSDFTLGPGVSITDEENYAWDWDVDIDAPNPIDEIDRLLIDLESKGWETILGREVDPTYGNVDLSAFAYKGRELIYVNAPSANQQTSFYVSYGRFPRNVGALLDGLHIPAGAQITTVEWTTTLHTLLVMFDSDMSVESYTAEVESNFENVGWSMQADEDSGYSSAELGIDAGVRAWDEGNIGMYVWDATCEYQTPWQ